MINRVLHIFLSFCLAVLFLFGNTRMEFIHLFTGHTDTVDVQRKGPAIENKHHHCAFLGFEVTAFANDYNFPTVEFIKLPAFTEKHSEISVSYIQRLIVHTSLRGPPYIA